MNKKIHNTNMNAVVKKENGVVFTPEWVVDFMVNEIFDGYKITGKEKILDAGCGEGIFAAVAARKFAELSSKEIENRVN